MLEERFEKKKDLLEWLYPRRRNGFCQQKWQPVHDLS
jgi:hypothetical protein